MAFNETELALDVSKRQAWKPPELVLGQGDSNGTAIAVAVMDHGEPLDLGGSSVFFEMMLPDRSTLYRVEGEASGNVAAFTIDESKAAAVPGRTDVAYVSVERGGEVVASTERIRVTVLKSAKSGKAAGTWTDELGLLMDEARGRISEVEGIIADVGGVDSLYVPLMGGGVRGGAKLGAGLEIGDDGELSVKLDGDTLRLDDAGRICADMTLATNSQVMALFE